MTMHTNVLCEALLHAQYGRRDTPCLADFPASVSRKEVEEVYLPFLASEEAQVRQNLTLGDVEIIGYDTASLLTVAGDAIAAGLVLAELLSEETTSALLQMNGG
ncbi:hypothetical protein TraAM80_03882 [Trypanosoma rangeli]|uniref:Uncharacterized protein n=1 Tax=Trypanosoma rangeli TaxID=5698 RepID=A0A422NLU4_TRYRA|nr:uncharacterized protein TraAM80_03882 [Trypanosoma rangeli]RNF06416.1 hypothetical protein TraAM80_03882 [Trypanosoma rangeli]|eukprot:RNF06416.1 hypothetical protein TraAM80_03882 [Trypanosoma rangeli]